MRLLAFRSPWTQRCSSIRRKLSRSDSGGGGDERVAGSVAGNEIPQRIAFRRPGGEERRSEHDATQLVRLRHDQRRRGWYADVAEGQPGIPAPHAARAAQAVNEAPDLTTRIIVFQNGFLPGFTDPRTDYGARSELVDAHAARRAGARAPSALPSSSPHSAAFHSPGKPLQRIVGRSAAGHVFAQVGKAHALPPVRSFTTVSAFAAMVNPSAFARAASRIPARASSGSAQKRPIFSARRAGRPFRSVHNVAFHAFTDDFRGAVGGGGQHWQAAGECLEADVRKRIVEGGENEKVGAAVGFLDFSGSPLERYAVRDAKCFRKGTIGCGIVAADDAQGRRVSCGHGEGQGFEQGREAFSPEILADERSRIASGVSGSREGENVSRSTPL